jgi:hypothetical protein
MADTARTPSSILGLFADNTAGDISAQDLRDFVQSVRHSHGVIEVNTGFNGAEGDTTGSEALVDAGIYNANALRNFSLSGSPAMQLNYSGESIGPCVVLNHGTVTGDSSTPGTVTLKNRKNFQSTLIPGTAASGSAWTKSIDDNAYEFFFASFFAELDNGDDIQQVYTANGQSPEFGPNTMIVLSLWGFDP